MEKKTDRKESLSNIQFNVLLLGAKIVTFKLYIERITIMERVGIDSTKSIIDYHQH